MTTLRPAPESHAPAARGVARAVTELDRIVQARNLDRLVRLRITSLLADRRWYRANRWAEWTDLRREGEVELRALLRLHRTARRLAAAQPDPVTLAKADRDHDPETTYWTAGR